MANTSQCSRMEFLGIRKFRSVFRSAIIVATLVSLMHTSVKSQSLYPVGDQMALGLYSSEGNVASLHAAGWNLFQTYVDPLALAAEAKIAGANIMGTLPDTSLAVSLPLTAQETQAYQNLAQTGVVTWWDLPEERNYLVPEEMHLLSEYVKLIRSNTAPLPTYMYIPSNYDVEDVAHYLPYIDIVPASIYPAYADEPYAWSRWRMEATVKGILNGGAIIGRDYRAGQKTPVAILELFYDPAFKGHRISPAGAYHDFWQALVSGAQGILIYSYFYRNDDSACQAAWILLQQAMKELTGPDRLDRVFLFGAPVSGIHFTITHGPAFTSTFAPVPEKPTYYVNYPAVDLAARRVDSTLYVVVVNSADSSVTVRLTGLLNGKQADVLFHNQSLPVLDGNLILDLEPLGVRILKLPGTTTSAREYESTQPREFELQQNYPNPFNPTTEISYQLPASCYVTLKVFDLLGNEISTLVNEVQDAGYHRISFNTESAHLASGVYFYRMISGSFSETKKMIVLK